MSTDVPIDSIGGADDERPLAIEWHPDALRPPFDWNIKLPPDWAVVETHPARWQRQNERIVDDYFDGRRVPSKVRKALLRSLEDVVAAAQRKKVLLTLLKPGVTEDGKIANVSMNLVFTSTSPRPASMAPIKKAFGTADTFTERTTPTGSAYATLTVRQKQLDGNERREVVSVQAFYPFPSTMWTLAVGITTPQLDLEDRLRDMAIRCVSSIRFDGADDASGAGASSDDLEMPSFDDAIDLVTYSVTK